MISVMLVDLVFGVVVDLICFWVSVITVDLLVLGMSWI